MMTYLTLLSISIHLPLSFLYLVSLDPRLPFYKYPVEYFHVPVFSLQS